MRVKMVVIVVASCLAGAAFAFAQSAPPPPPPALPAPSPQSAVHVTTRIVQVSVTVVDDRGRPVTGFTKDDFILTDEGQPQQIASFSEPTGSITTTRAVASPNFFTNRSEQGAAAQRPLIVVVIDAFNSHGDTRLVLNEVERFVRNMQPEDRIALYELTMDNLYLLQDFTSDTSALLRGIVRGREYAANIHPRMMFAQDVDEQTMDAMRRIADKLAKVPGRKNLIWLTGGFPPVPLNDGGVGITYDMMNKTAKTLGNSDLPLFAIDAHGLVAGSGGGGGPVPGGGRRGPTSGTTLPHPSSSGGCSDTTSGCASGAHDFEFTKNLAETSGGRAYYDTNDLASAIRKVVDDSASTYVLGYYPDHNKWNGEFREIKVNVNRPGLEVRARNGYYAVADTATATERDAQKLADAIRSPVESTDLGFDVQADGIEISGARQLKVKISLDASQLHFEQQGMRWTDNVTATWAQFSAVGEQVGAQSQTINLKPMQEAYQQLLKQGLNFSETVALEKNAVEVHLVLRDAGNGAIGSVIIPIGKLFLPDKSQTPEKK
jgi:VWFA-related protein